MSLDVGEHDDGSFRQQLKFMVVNLIKNFSRPGGLSVNAKDLDYSSVIHADSQDEVSYICGQISAEYDRIQELQNTFGYLPEKSFSGR